MYIDCVAKMKTKQLRFRLSDRRFWKLQLYASQHDKTMTQVIEELLDTLPEPKMPEGRINPAN